MAPQIDSRIERIAGREIVDYRKYPYSQSETPSNPTENIPTIPATHFLRDLASLDARLYHCTSLTQLVGKLSQIAESFDTSATFNSDNNTQRESYCANRDNTYQLIKLLY